MISLHDKVIVIIGGTDGLNTVAAPMLRARSAGGYQSER